MIWARCICKIPADGLAAVAHHKYDLRLGITSANHGRLFDEFNQRLPVGARGGKSILWALPPKRAAAELRYTKESQ